MPIDKADQIQLQLQPDKTKSELLLVPKTYKFGPVEDMWPTGQNEFYRPLLISNIFLILSTFFMFSAQKQPWVKFPIAFID